MDKNSNKYTFIYAIVMVVVVAVVLSVTATSLKQKQKDNVTIDRMQNILRSVKVEASVTEAKALFGSTITSSIVVKKDGSTVSGEDAFKVSLKKQFKQKDDSNMLLPLYIADMGSKGKKYIIPLYGAGLWGPIWGYVSLNDDFSTIYGANFDHQGETPGLGAEISTDNFEMLFDGKQFIKNGAFTPFAIAKPGKKYDLDYGVDGMAGATLTCKGVESMINKDIALYQNYFKKIAK